MCVVPAIDAVKGTSAPAAFVNLKSTNVRRFAAEIALLSIFLMASLNVMVKLAATETLVALFAGLKVREGGCVSPVVKVMLVGLGLMRLSLLSSTPAIAT